MSSSQSKDESSSSQNIDRRKDSENPGKEYEKMAFALLAKKSWELTNDFSKGFSNFALGREVDIGDDSKLGDIVVRYDYRNNTNNCIFAQIKHKAVDSLQLNSDILVQAEGSGCLSKAFNLRQYFTSFCNIKEAMISGTVSKELKSAKIKYVVLFTNIDLNIDDFNRKGFSLKKAPDDIEKLFALKQPSSREDDDYKHCYQLDTVSDELLNVFKKCSDLHRLARELALYIVSEKYKNHIMGIDKAPIKQYHRALEREVFEKSNMSESKSAETQKMDSELARFRDEFIDNDKNDAKKQLLKQYDIALEREVIKTPNMSERKSAKKQKMDSELARFRDEFIDNDKSNLLNAIFAAIRETDELKENMSDEDLKKCLKEAKWKVVPNFGEGRNGVEKIPDKWISVDDGIIEEFLNCLVLSVKQPNIIDFTAQISSKKEIFLDRTQLGEMVDKMGVKFKDRMEKTLEIYKKTPRAEKWIFGEEISKFVLEQQEAVNAVLWTLKYELKVMQYGKFKLESGDLEVSLDRFLNDERSEEISEDHLKRKRRRKEKNFKTEYKQSKILCVYTTTTLLTVVKILGYLNSKTYRTENGHISVELDDLKCKALSASIEAAFRSESHSLLIVECLDEQVECEKEIKDLCYRFYDIVKDNPNKKVILIIGENKIKELTDLKESLKRDCDSENNCFEINDDILVTDFEPEGDPLERRIVVFQGQKEKVNLASLTGISNWNNYINYISTSSTDEIKNEKHIIDATTLVEILKNNPIVIGSKSVGTDRLEGAYATLFEEMNKETFVNKLLQTGNDCDTTDMYIVSGIRGLNRNEKMGKLIEYLGLIDKKVEIEKLSRDDRIKITDGKFKNKDFKDICHKHPEKNIFWTFLNEEEKIILQQFYNPSFYLKRKFKNVVMNKKVKGLLIRNNLLEIFIFSRVNDLENLLESLGLTDETEKRKIKNNCENRKIQFFPSEDAAKATFKGLCKKKQTAHCFKLEENKLIWLNTHGAVTNLQDFIDEKNESALIEEDNLIKEIRYRKVVIIADDPGMGKTITLTMLLESFIATHWVILLNLRFHLQAIRNIEQVNGNIDVINFFTEVDVTLNHNLAKTLLLIALDKSKKFSRPLLVAFDGFDEVLDVEDRSKIISLLKFLKEETSAKVWITTRLHYKKLLEEELSTFAVEFVAMDKKVKKAYIEKYLKDRLYFILSEENFANFFLNNDEVQENTVCSHIPRNIHNYTEAFLNEMELIFKHEQLRFIGTPLQLYLMLGGSTSHIKNWIENKNKNLNFNNLGQDLWEVYEKFIDRKYEVYFQKARIIEREQQRFQKVSSEDCHKKLVSFANLGVEVKKSVVEFKDVLLSLGIIKSQGSNIEFIHTTFKEFFAAKLFFDWIKKEPNELLNEQQNTLSAIFTEKYYQVIRAFINPKLKKITESELQEISLNYRIISEKFPVYEAVLYIAVEEGNTNIACFLLNTLKGHRDMKKILFWRNKSKETVLHLACERGYHETVKALLVAAEEISEDTLQKFLHFIDSYGYNALDRTLCHSDDIESAKMLFKKASNKLDLIVSEKKNHSSLCLACEHHKFAEFVKLLLQEFKGDAAALKKILLFEDSEDTAVIYAINAKDSCNTILEDLLYCAKSIDESETLKMLLLPKNGLEPLNVAVNCGRIDLVNIILNSAKNINDNNDTLKQLLLSVMTAVYSLDLAAVSKYSRIMKILLETAALVDDEISRAIMSFLVKKGKIQVTDANGYEEICVGTLIIFEEDHSMRRKLIDLYHSILLSDALRHDKETLINAILGNNICKVKDILDKAKNSMFNSEEKVRILLFLIDEDGGLRWNALQTACFYGHADIVKELLSFAIGINDESETLKKLLLPKEGLQPLNLAVNCGKIDLVNIILNSAKNINDESETLKKLLLPKEGLQPLNLAVNCGKIDLVNIILNSAKNINDESETLKKLLLPKEGLQPLNLAVNCGKIDLVNIILNSAKNITDNNYTLKQLLLNVMITVYSLDLAAVSKYSGIMKILLETAALIDDEISRAIMSFLVKKGKTTIQVTDANGYEEIYVDTLKIFEEDKYHNNRRKLIDLYNSILMSDTLRLDKQELINAIVGNNICKVKDILDNAKNSMFDSEEKVRILLFLIDEDVGLRWNALHTACFYGHADIVKELLSFAIGINDEGETLKKLITSRSINNKTPFEVIKGGHITDIKQIIESLILDNRKGNNERVATILQEIQKYDEFIEQKEEESFTNCPFYCANILRSWFQHFNPSPRPHIP